MAPHFLDGSSPAIDLSQDERISPYIYIDALHVRFPHTADTPILFAVGPQHRGPLARVYVTKDV